jgi:predicted dehydrogenase
MFMRVALAGAEHWHAAFYLSSFRRAGAQIVGVSDPREGPAKRLAADAACPAFDDYRLMIERTKPDFIMATARHAEMAKLAVDLLGFGIPMGVEKPLGLNAAEVATVVDEATRRNTFVAVPLINRYSLLWRELASLAAAGRAGLRSHAHFRVINGVPRRYQDLGVGWMLEPAVSGGGCLINLGIHAADAFLLFAETKEATVLASALTHRVHRLPIEEMAAALLRSPDGIIGSLEAGYSYATEDAGGDFELRVATANCYLVDRGDSLQIATLDDGRTRTIRNLNPKERYEHFGEDTLGRLEAGEGPAATVEDCFRAVRLLDKIYERAAAT